MTDCHSDGAQRLPSAGMTCREFVDFIGDYLEQRLAEDVAAEFGAHIAACPPCLDYLDGLEKTCQLPRLCAEHPDDGLPAGLPEGLVQAVLAARRRQR